MKAQLTTVLRVHLGCAVLLFSASLCAEPSAEKGSIPTELLATGDDALTLGFRSSLEEATEKSSYFSRPTSRDANVLVMTIPTNVYARPAQGKLNFQYVVIFTDRHSTFLGASIHSCWDDRIHECAAVVLREARQAWARRVPDGA